MIKFARKRDEKIADLAWQLTDTESILPFIIKIIRFGEFRSIHSNLYRLAGIIRKKISLFTFHLKHV